MKKTYITTMPDHIGAFLKASECFASLGINITRVSYNKAVDSHTLFIDAEGDEEQLRNADTELAAIGYLHNDKNENSIVLLQFMLKDVPGSVTEVLRLINSFELNISYISSQEDGSGHQAFKMGLFVDDEDKLRDFLKKANELCPVCIMDYNRSKRIFDNSIFYQSFVSGLMHMIGLPEQAHNKLLVNSNLIMQILDEKGLSPFKTFESISRFAELLSVSRGSDFVPRITECTISGKTKVTVIEPPCGSNTMILQSCGEVLFIDCGYAIYEKEMLRLFRGIFPDYDNMKKRICVTHADVDHCGLLNLFDEIIASHNTALCFGLESSGGNGYREQNPLHRPYVNICKTLTFYKPPKPEKLFDIWEPVEQQDELLKQIGTLVCGEMVFAVYQGKGGHLSGETVLVDHEHKVAFTGDIFVNIPGMTREQAEYNRYAPVLMTSVDTDPGLCTAERNALLKSLGAGEWKIFGSHGSVKEYTV